MTHPYDAWNFELVARFFLGGGGGWESVHAPLVLSFLGLDLRGNWVSRIFRRQFPQILQRSPLIPVQFCNCSAVLNWTSRTDFRQTRVTCLDKHSLNQKDQSVSFCMPLFLHLSSFLLFYLPSPFILSYFYHFFFPLAFANSIPLHYFASFYSLSFCLSSFHPPFQWRTQEFCSEGGGVFNKFSWGQRTERTGDLGAVAP